ncbi:MAG TPA: histidine kinase [Chitinophagaceae bacterium]|nr:histidine kinase [Chitinophagaceae bacterium]
MRKIFQTRYIFHVLFWLMYSLFVILDSQGYIMKRSFAFSLEPLAVHLLLMAFLVYGHTLVLIPYLLEKKRAALYVISIIVLIITFTLVRSWVQLYWDAVVWPDEVMKLPDYFKWNLFYGVWFVLISSMLLYTQKWSEQRQQVKNIQINQLQTELKYLRAQINPHFLFNGLNTIYGYIDINNQQARDILVQFSDLLRYNLYEADVDMIELEQEIRFLQSYVALQRARSNDNMTIDLVVNVVDNHVKIAPLLCMAFVENAFKYATRDSKENTVSIYLGQKDNKVYFTCRNTCEAVQAASKGIGLNNVMRRLELLYKDRYVLDIKKQHDLYEVALTLTI